MSTLRVNNITDNSGGTNNLNVPGTAKAWVNFNGTGTVAIRASFNVSSITDNGVGEYTVNFTTALADANYSVHYTAGPSAAVGTVVEFGSTAPTASGVRVSTYGYTNGANVDRTYNCVAIFR